MAGVGYKNFGVISKLLEKQCIQHQQVAYNVVALCWVLSYRPETHVFFSDYRMGIIEKVSKILDYFNTEKIVRIMLMLFDNLKDFPDMQEHLSDIDALSILIKLKNKHWVDEDINILLKKLYEYFDENQQVYSSIDKLRNQVERGQLRWGPCHTEKFWQENAT